MTTYTTNGGAQYHVRTNDIPAVEIKAGLIKSDTNTKIIVSTFLKNPNLRINPSAMRETLGIDTPIHGFRPRFTELRKAGFLRRLDERVKSGFGGKEHIYALNIISTPGEQMLMF